MKTQLIAAVAACAGCATLPAFADPVSWSQWSGVTTGATSGAASASFGATGVSASYSGELESLQLNYPSYTPGTTFSGGTVDNPPPSANGILQIYGGGNTGTNTITFSQAVLNPVIAIWSLGQPGITGQFVFNQAFTIQAAGTSAEYGGNPISAIGNTVYGVEGNGVIQFSGSITSISWTNPVFENWYGFTVGVPTVAAVPEPETYALMLAGLAALGVAARRRKSKA